MQGQYAPHLFRLAAGKSLRRPSANVAHVLGAAASAAAAIVQRPKVQQPASQSAQAAARLALSLVGKRIEVWWEDDQRYYAGRITHFNTGATQTRQHTPPCL
jgi:hypothetical protein